MHGLVVSCGARIDHTKIPLHEGHDRRVPVLTFIFQPRNSRPMDEKEVEDHAHNIATESTDMGDEGFTKSVDGQCDRCDKDAVWEDPVDERQLCETHAKEHFRERHG